MVDAADLKSADRKVVRVRVPLAPSLYINENITKLERYVELSLRLFYEFPTRGPKAGFTPIGANLRTR
jgi:hypothetical protein